MRFGKTQSLRTHFVMAVLVACCFRAGVERARAAVHEAVGKPVQLKTPPNPRYPGSAGSACLTNGIMGDPDFHNRDWLGFEGPDLEATVDLGAPIDIQALGGDFLQYPGPGIFLPTKVTFAVSSDGRTFREVAAVTHDVPEREAGPLTRRLVAEGLHVKARFVRVHAFNIGRIPAWHHAGGIKAWLFVDEILVNPKSESEAAFAAVLTYRFGQPRRSLAYLEELAKRTVPGSAARAKLRKRLRSVLTSPDATLDGKRFACRLLARIGTNAEVPILAAMLRDPATAEMARFALWRMATPAATAALRNALRETRGQSRCGVIAALGALRDPGSAAALCALLTDPDSATAASAARALAKIGGDVAASALAGAFDTAGPEVRAVLPDACLECARRTAAGGNRAASRLLYRTVSEKSAVPEIRTAALAGLAEMGDQPSMAALVEALNGDDPRARRTAAGFARTTRNGALVDLLIAELPGLHPRTQLLLLGILADREETKALPAMVQACESKDAAVRAAALRALGCVGDRSIVPVLCRAAGPARPREEREAAETALCRLRGKGVDEAIVTAMTGASAPVRATLIRCLGKRRAGSAAARILSAAKDEDASVRIAAFRALAVLATPRQMPALVDLLLKAEDRADCDEAGKAVVALSRRIPPQKQPARAVLRVLASVPNLTPDRKARLLAVLGRIGDVSAESALVAALNSPRANVQAAAIQALSRWPSDAPIAPLLEAARTAADARNRILALRAAVELAGRRIDARSPLATLDILKKAMAAAARDGERKRVLGTAGRITNVDALDFAARYAAFPGISSEACTAVLEIAEKLKKAQPDRVAAALETVIQHAPDKNTRETARRTLADIAKRMPDAAVRKRLEHTPWQALFNGNDLEGWRTVRGGPNAWSAAKGVLRANKGFSGWIATVREYADFVIELEFRLPPGGNSGLFLRAPLGGNPAFSGMEVQILDDYARQYRNLKPEQYCASVYGIAAATPRVSRHAGEWQHLSVLCVGRLVRVHLNGTLVAAANLDDHLDKAGRIPGIKRTRGFIGLQNEHGPIEFRNLRIKDLTERMNP